MPNILIRDLTPETINKLKVRARRSGRSMQSELKTVLEQAAQVEFLETEILSSKIRRMLGDREHTDSAELTEKGG